MMHEMVPKATVIGVLVNARNPIAQSYTEGAQKAMRALGLEVQLVQASTEREIDAARVG